MEGHNFESLPSEIVIKIALMLSTRTLITLKRTCKFWHKFLNDPQFVDLHLCSAIESPCYFYQWRFCGYGGFTFAKKLSADHDLEEKDILQAYVPWSEPFDSKLGESTVLSSGGLMASYVIEHECFRVFNPFILSEQVNVANPLDHQAFDHVPNSFFFKSWGFDYYLSSKEYKIFKLLVGRKTIKGQVYKINGANHDDRRSWRTITFSDCCPSHFTDHVYTVECEATLYWKAKPHVVVHMLINYLRPRATSLVSPSRIMAMATKT